MSVKIIIADDHKIMREGLRNLLESQEDFQLVGEAGNGRKAIQLAQELSPDLIVMDTVMSDLNGMEATRQIISKNPHIRIIALSMYSDRQFVVEMLRAGASGYILKDCAFEELVYAIRSVLNDEIYLSPKIARVVLKDFVKGVPESKTSVFSDLSNREREVLQLIAEGNTTREIAGQLNVSIKTIETHRQQIMKKLKIKSVAGLTKYAIREGLTPLEN